MRRASVERNEKIKMTEDSKFSRNSSGNLRCCNEISWKFGGFVPSEKIKIWKIFERCTPRRFGDVVVRIPPGHPFSTDTSFQAAKSVGVCALERRCWSRCRVSLRLKVWLHCAASLCVSELGYSKRLTKTVHEKPPLQYL